MAATAAVAAAATTPAALAADGSGQRAYELVSPLEKGGGQAGVALQGTLSYTRASEDGNRIVYSVNGTFGDAPRGLTLYEAGARTASGWAAQAAIPGPEPGIGIGYVRDLPSSFMVSDDGAHTAFTAGFPYVQDNPRDPNDIDSGAGAYTSSVDGPIDWLTRPVSDAATPRPPHLGLSTSMFVAGGSTDFSTVYFGYCGTLTDADAPRTGRSNYGFYVSEDGQVETAGTLPDGTVDPDGAQPVTGLGSNCYAGPGPQDPASYGNPVSADGRQALFVSPDPSAGSGRPTQLYLHRRGAPSVLVSRSEVTGAAAPSGVLGLNNGYAIATRDGAHVVFTSADRLTDDAPADSVPKYYRYDVATGDVVYLDGIATFDGAAAIPYTVSDDGERILFSRKVVSGLIELSIWDHGQVVDAGTIDNANILSATHMHVSSDGSTYVFDAISPFLDGATTHSPGTTQVYRYVLGQSGPPTCLSCVPSGQTSAGSSYVSSWNGGSIGSAQANDAIRVDARNVSSDGRRVFFDSADPLVSRDTNGKRDVYEWFDGTLSLISTGQSERDSYLLDSSASTDDVFFTTAEGIEPGDNDENYDVYDARVGGGFPHAVSVPCAGDTCQPAPSVASASPPAASVMFSGVGDAPLAARPVAASVSVSKVKTVTGSVATVKVKVPGAGAIALSGTSLRRSTKTATRATTYSVKVALTAKAKASLAKHTSLRLKVRVSFTPKQGAAVAKTVSVTFKASKRGRS